MTSIMQRTWVSRAKRERDNKGFSLIELIVVIAIMVGLTAILAPQLLRYVEQSRVARDATTVDETFRAIQIALADETTYNAVATSTTIVYARDGKITVTSAIPAGSAAMATELNKTLGGTVATNVISNLPTFVSNGKNNETYTVTISSGVISITHASNV